MKRKLILWSVLLVAAFLFGFLPQYSKLSQASAELEATRDELTSCRFNEKLSRVRDLAAMAYLEATRKNFGLAADHSKQFFDLLREVANETTEPELKQKLNELLGSRDTITAGLASVEPSILPDLQQLVIKTFEATKR